VRTNQDEHPVSPVMDGNPLLCKPVFVPARLPIIETD
jgi:hypothetical protein